MGVLHGILLAVIFAAAGVLCANETTTYNPADVFIKDWDENVLGREETDCRKELNKAGVGASFYIISGAILTLSVIFLILSVGVFIFIQRYLVREMDEAVYKAHDVMDAVMVSLIPNALLDDIGAKEGRKKEN